MKNAVVLLNFITLVTIVMSSIGAGPLPLTPWLIGGCWLVALASIMAVGFTGYVIPWSQWPTMVVFFGIMALLYPIRDQPVGNYIYGLPILAVLPLLMSVRLRVNLDEPVAAPFGPPVAGPQRGRSASRGRV